MSNGKNAYQWIMKDNYLIVNLIEYMYDKAILKERTQEARDDETDKAH